MAIFRIPTYDIVFWYFLKPETEKFKKRAIILAEAFPYKAIAYKGVQNVRWGRENESQAIAIFERLKSIADDPNVLVLRLISNRNDFQPVTYKDVRQSLKYCWE
jgi:hypothetical protein